MPRALLSSEIDGKLLAAGAGDHIHTTQDWTFDLFQNARAAERGRYPFPQVLSAAEGARAFSEIRRWDGYGPTPLRNLNALAQTAGVRAVLYKDEGSRFGLGSFKALGGAYAVARLLQKLLGLRLGRGAGMADLADPHHRDWIRGVTVACASDGNHGRSVAAAARRFGCGCHIFLHEGVSVARARAISDLGASVVRTPGTYDDSVRAALETSKIRGWHVVADTAEDPLDPMPIHVMHGYATLAIEALDQLRTLGSPSPTHVFLQGGVGGLAAAMIAYFWDTLGQREAPIFVIVEPKRADCLYQSARNGKPTPASGDLDTLMAGLSCGEVSRVAWPILQAGAEFFMTVKDAAAVECMRALRQGTFGGGSIVGGESGVAGLAGLVAATLDSAKAAGAINHALGQMRLDASSTVLLIGTEGATDPEIYEKLTANDLQGGDGGLVSISSQ